MTDDEFLLKLREAFVIEAEEHLHALTSGLLELEKGADETRRTETTETIYREAHSLKGAARAVSRDDIESVCQALESVFAQWKQNPAPVAAETFDVLNRAVDLLARRLRLPDAAVATADHAEITDMMRQLGGGSAQPPPAARTTPAPAPEPEPPAAPEAETLQLGGAVRVRMAKLDSLLRHAEEMIGVKLTVGHQAAELHALSGVFAAWRKEWAGVRDITRSGLTAQSPAALAKLAGFLEWNQDYMRTVEKRLTTLAATAARDERSTGALIDDLLADAKRLVMLPFATLLDVFPKIVRDLGRDQRKEIALHLDGREIEIDKRILHEMKDALLHLVRNSIDHGLEEPRVRTAAHKPATGSLTLAVTQLDGSKIEILIADDGAGIDLEKVKAAAVRAGILSEEEARKLDEKAALSLVFASGVSTSRIITEISGRGLGMAIAREKVERLGGTIAIETARGAGTTFRIVLPVTLATFQGVLVGAGGQTFVIPTVKIDRIKRVTHDEIRTVENRETIVLEGRIVALARLSEVLGLPPRAEADAHIEVVVLGTAENRIGFAVDAVMSEQEVLVKIIGKPLVRVRNIAGATLLASGSPVLILNTTELLQNAVRLSSAPGRARPRKAEPAARPRSILVADDSITSRMLLKNILESAGYIVTVAIDGVDALTALKTHDFDALVSDVEMPRMDGFDLTAKVRADKKLGELPVVLVTALGSREHQERGAEAGANAYIVKGSFDQSNLLEVLRKLV